jgi:hypothetical protein
MHYNAVFVFLRGRCGSMKRKATNRKHGEAALAAAGARLYSFAVASACVFSARVFSSQRCHGEFGSERCLCGGFSRGGSASEAVHHCRGDPKPSTPFKNIAVEGVDEFVRKATASLAALAEELERCKERLAAAQATAAGRQEELERLRFARMRSATLEGWASRRFR